MPVVNQPSVQRLGNLLIANLVHQGEESFDTLYILVAYAKRSGVRQLSQHIKAFRQRGSRVSAIVGIDNKNTSKEGLEALLDCVDEAFVYHDVNRSHSFHPKLYIFERTGQMAEVFIGSSNLTYGGLFSNSEVDVHLQYNLRDPEDGRAFEEILAVFEHYKATGACCVGLDPALIDELHSDNLLGSETGREREPGAADGDATHAPRRKIFGTAELHEAPIFRPPTPSVVETQSVGFWKALGRFDVSRRAAPGQIIIPIGFSKYFPELGSLESRTHGAMQADIFFDIEFCEEDQPSVIVEGVRAIVYIPAPTHPRPNRELRFTFRNRGIFDKLRENDVLEFQRTDQESPWFRITLVPVGTSTHRELMATGVRFGELG